MEAENIHLSKIRHMKFVKAIILLICAGPGARHHLR
jgi:hypothetical protein